MEREPGPATLPPLGIRKRFVMFSAAWLILCVALLTAYLVSQTKRTLLGVALQHSQSLASGVAKEVTLYLHAGDGRAVESLLNDVQKQPDVIAATVEQDRSVWGRRVAQIEVLETLSSPSGKSASPGGARLIRADGRRAIEAREPILMPPPSDVLSDQSIFEEAAIPTTHGYAVVIVSVERIFKEMDALVTKSMVFWGFVLAVGLVVGWLISGVMVSPLKQLAHDARRWTAGDEEAVSPRTPPLAGDDEIRSLWSSLTAMKSALDRKTTEIARLQGSVEDTVRQHTADLQEMNRRLSEILALKNDLLLQVSHEIKTPLTALSALISNLHDEVVGELTGRQRDYLSRAMAMTTQVRRLLTTLLDFAMAETGKIHLNLRPIDMAKLAQEALDALQPLREGKGVSCVIAESMRGKRAIADPDRVQQILLNLVHNAIKASPPRSTVILDAQAAGSDITVSVRDSGPGIPPSDRATLLRQPLPSGSRPQGSGVGLCICRYLVELHGGRIWFESEDAKGTAFFFTLPSSPAPVATEP